MDFRIWLQFAEAFGPVNRWFCSEAHRKSIDDQNLLLAHYVRSGGAADFARRYNQAMDFQNRWFCSEFHHRDVRNPLILWKYYMNHAPIRLLGGDHRYELDIFLAEMTAAG